ncbi:TPA: hypothetical protein DEW49_04065, partial [bacterium]|nr:hypothetical protein [bacterium]
SYEEIGKVMNLSLPAVKSLLHRAKESLKKKLEGVNYTPPPHILPL